MRIWIPLLIGVLLLVGIYLWRTPPKSPEQSALPEKLANVENPSTEPEQTAVRRPRPRRNGEDASGSTAGQPSSPAAPRLGRAEQIEYAIRNANQPIYFYGKVVDQNDAPMSGVRIHLRYTEHQLAGAQYGENNEPVDLVSDDNGRFELTGVKGSRISIESVSKSGYQLSSKAPLTPGTNIDPAAPVIFRMWKKQGADQLIGMRLSRQAISVEGVPITFDLFEGKKNAGTPDLKVTLTRTPVHIARGANHFDWTATLEIDGGGLLPTQDEFAFEAPEGGYQSRLVYEFKKENENWLPLLRRQFYIKLRGQYFGRLNVDLSASGEPPPTLLTVESSINPTGSRNLEPK